MRPFDIIVFVLVLKEMQLMNDRRISGQIFSSLQRLEKLHWIQYGIISRKFSAIWDLMESLHFKHHTCMIVNPLLIDTEKCTDTPANIDVGESFKFHE